MSAKGRLICEMWLPLSEEITNIRQHGAESMARALSGSGGKSFLSARPGLCRRQMAQS